MLAHRASSTVSAEQGAGCACAAFSMAMQCSPGSEISFLPSPLVLCTQASPAERAALRRSSGRLECPAVNGGDGRGRCGESFSSFQLARVVDEQTYAVWEAAQKELAAEDARKEERRHLEERQAARDKRTHAAGGASGAGSTEARVAMLAERVREDILTLKCPSCGFAFAEYDGCAALKCPSCSTGFCAYCLQRCGGDAHAHVASCAYGAGTYARKEQYEAVQAKRKLQEIGKLLDEQPSDDVRTALLKAIERDAKDNGVNTRALKKRGGWRKAAGLPNSSQPPDMRYPQMPDGVPIPPDLMQGYVGGVIGAAMGAANAARAAMEAAMAAINPDIRRITDQILAEGRRFRQQRTKRGRKRARYGEPARYAAQEANVRMGQREGGNAAEPLLLDSSDDEDIREQSAALRTAMAASRKTFEQEEARRQTSAGAGGSGAGSGSGRAAADRARTRDKGKAPVTIDLTGDTDSE